MRLYNILFSIFFALAVTTATGQIQPSSDSTLAQGIRRLSVQLTLTQKQEASLFDLEKQLIAHMDSLAHSKTSQDQRQASMVTALAEHDRQLKGLFTDVQWKKYQDIKAARKAAFRKRAADKHIVIHELEKTKG